METGLANLRLAKEINFLTSSILKIFFNENYCLQEMGLALRLDIEKGMISRRLNLLFGAKNLQIIDKNS